MVLIIVNVWGGALDKMKPNTDTLEAFAELESGKAQFFIE